MKVIFEGEKTEIAKLVQENSIRVRRGLLTAHVCEDEVADSKEVELNDSKEVEVPGVKATAHGVKATAEKSKSK